MFHPASLKHSKTERSVSPGRMALLVIPAITLTALQILLPLWMATAGEPPHPVRRTASGAVAYPPAEDVHFKRIDEALRHLLQANTQDLTRLDALYGQIDPTQQAVRQLWREAATTQPKLIRAQAANRKEFDLHAKDMEARLHRMEAIPLGMIPAHDEDVDALKRNLRTIKRDFAATDSRIMGTRLAPIRFHPMRVKRQLSHVHALLRLEQMLLIANRVVFSTKGTLRRITNQQTNATSTLQP